MGISKLENLLGGSWNDAPKQETAAPAPTPKPGADRPMAANPAHPAPQPAAAPGVPPADDVDSADVEREVAVTIRAPALGGELLQVVVDPDYWKEHRAEIAAAPGVPYFVDELAPLLDLPLADFRLLHEVKKRTGGTVIPENHPQHAYHQTIFRCLKTDGPAAGSAEAITAERRAKRWYPYPGQEKDLKISLTEKESESK